MSTTITDGSKYQINDTEKMKHIITALFSKNTYNNKKSINIDYYFMFNVKIILWTTEIQYAKNQHIILTLFKLVDWVQWNWMKCFQ